MPETKPKSEKNGTKSSQICIEVQADLHPAWQAMIRFCNDLGYGEIACVKIYDGVPISAEVAKKKIRWS